MEENLSEIIKNSLRDNLNKNQELALDYIISFIENKKNNNIFLLKKANKNLEKIL